MTETEKGFLIPQYDDSNKTEFLARVCMSSGAFWKNKAKYSIWGDVVIEPFYAYSNDLALRQKASSGGMISEIASFLLEAEIVDAVIQIKVSGASQIKTEVVVSKSRDEVISCCGSRYTISSPLFDICTLLENGKRYAFIGKPCDVLAVRNWTETDSEIKEKIPVLLSFMCAGMPSKKAENRLLNELNTSEKDCSVLTYRGNGWPGYTIATMEEKETGRMTYAESWGKILGRDVALCCRLCYDGIGEAADIACGDGWYIKNGRPDFSEHNGRNIVFVRNEIGKTILDEMERLGIITCEKTVNPYEDLKTIQNYQYVRRTTMREKILALKLYGRSVPMYPKRMLRELGKESTLGVRGRIFLGTLKRLHENKI